MSAPLNPCPGAMLIGAGLCEGCARRSEELKGVALIPAVRKIPSGDRMCVNRVPLQREG